MQSYDVIVLGLGAMGSAATYQLAKRGQRVLGIDRFAPPHAQGSSHGDTRITRLAIGEGDQYVPLARRSHEIWRELEAETGRSLMTTTGGLIISSDEVTMSNHVPHFFDNTIAAARKYGIKHDLLDAGQIRKKFPPFNVHDADLGYYEHDAGFLRPEQCIGAQLDMAKKHGAELRLNERVTAYAEDGGGVRVTTEKGEYRAEQLIVAAGGWLPTFLEDEFAKHFAIERQVLFWFDIKESPELYAPDRFPIFIWELRGNQKGMYGFPAIDGARGGIKIASEQYVSRTTAEHVDRIVHEDEARMMYNQFIKPNFPGISEKCVRSAACMYTITPDNHFVIDRHPRNPAIIIASPCSGHGFKHSAAVGETLAQMVVDGKPDTDISGFGLLRLRNEGIGPERGSLSI